MKKKVAIFDIDGTIFRSSLLIEVTESLVYEGVFPLKVRDIYTKSYNNWLNRKGSYEKYIGEVINAFEQNMKNIKYVDFVKASKNVIAFHKSRVYRYTRQIVKDLKKKNYFMLAISNSPKELVDDFCSNLGFDKVYGRVYEVGKNGKFTGKTLYLDLVSDKAKILQRAVEKEGLTLKGSIGVGDTESDIKFLKLVQRPICFNPNKKLYNHAKSVGWEIVVERKDVIYKI
ncbi:MAG: HAD-superfamily subfamily IB hydrolase, TIGR01490 [Parcubacteria group bacterium GW2011_GWA2_33_14]|uniref:Haloacid dehalogenase n=1 Tax=Candidatus Staskawiczbacteria bacterium RIFCSPHIGHO2_02_FULL_33_16 TaxID=1802204 RepID=A0A1G2HUD2_9BACT|nr:MAG: HAD-superfamily subfamily IB hydrolase, TIGR01490 [Parcubacteria group bacterium GW2011_GWA2_33_14]OGZ65841.1 MAG: hypothetical protein A3D34_03275 [Candidatus Staskawiczbacteria bacterium RIFCSPHIGHO2_02_FULL_33_16]OGZ70497.1 MAG: hypothetical protein A2980_00920 [Candidatus Staskawiczbacteria bacterium RIFCSPLOWO2_01_FULL_33_13]